MLQRLINSARVNVFESARFYYWVLVVLTSYFLFNRFLQKLSFVYLDNRWIELKVGEGILFGLAYLVILISAWFLRKKIPGFVFWCWFGIVLIFLINEFRFAWGNPNYSLMESFTKSQGYYTAKFTMPLLFWGVWSVLNNTNHFRAIFIYQLRVFLTINAVLICSGSIFDISLFKSYPLSDRWGYSGLLWHLNFHCASYGILLIHLLKKEDKDWVSIFLFVMSLFLLGQKAGILYILLIFMLMVIKNNLLRATILTASLVGIISAPVWTPIVVGLAPFWEQVYYNHGVWGIIFSLRNESVYELFFESEVRREVVDWVFGGYNRYPVKVEMMAFDIFAYFGALGLFLKGFFLVKIIPHLVWGIPIIVACFAGGIYEAPMALLLLILALD
tara:strand:+ start:1306 stop:2469 length:1164 start_codon:yes stop_codon:yes gene_type:complete